MPSDLDPKVQPRTDKRSQLLATLATTSIMFVIFLWLSLVSVVVFRLLIIVLHLFIVSVVSLWLIYILMVDCHLYVLPFHHFVVVLHLLESLTKLLTVKLQGG